MLGKYISNTMRIQVQFRSMHLASVTRKQVVESKDYKWMGEYVKAVTTAPHGTNVTNHVESIDEYFRKNFRKMSPRQALEILEPLGSNVE